MSTKDEPETPPGKEEESKKEETKSEFVPLHLQTDKTRAVHKNLHFHDSTIKLERNLVLDVGVEHYADRPWAVQNISPFYLLAILIALISLAVALYLIF